MEESSKVISGLRRGSSFTLSERHHIIQEMLSSDFTKTEIWKKYTGQSEEHGYLLKWMRQLGYSTKLSARRFTFGEKYNLMAKKQPS
ncbi:MAG: hypothetical protein WAL29_13185, partial [Bacteroidales bacterium]